MELLKDKIAVITGGTRGIGLAAARVFLQNGAKTAILGSRKETVEQAMNQLRQEMPDCPVQGYWPDLTCREQVRQTMEQVAGQWGRVDILVNNAGISQRTPLYDYQPGEFEKIMALNVNAVFLCSQAAAEIMRRQPVWSTCRRRVSDLQIRRQRHHPLLGSGAWAGQYPGQRRGAGSDRYRHGSRLASGDDGAFGGVDSLKADGKTRRYRQRFFVPSLRFGLLCQRRGAFGGRGRHGIMGKRWRPCR